MTVIDKANVMVKLLGRWTIRKLRRFISNDHALLVSRSFPQCQSSIIFQLEEQEKLIRHDIVSLTKKLDSIDFSVLKDAPQQQNNVEELQSDAEVVIKILKQSCKKYEKEGR